jgi:hypothetical protein
VFVFGADDAERGWAPLRLRGTYDDATRSGTFHDTDGPEWRLVHGQQYVRLGKASGLTKGWLALDYSRFGGVPKDTIQAAYFADPALFFAIADAVTGDVYSAGVVGGVETFNVSIDREAAIAAAGSLGQALDQVLPTTSVLADIRVRGGRLVSVGFTGQVTGANGATPGGSLRITGYGVPAVSTQPPPAADTVRLDVTRLGARR